MPCMRAFVYSEVFIKRDEMVRHLLCHYVAAIPHSEACGCTFRMSKLSVEPQESSHMLCPSSQQLENHQSSSISSYAELFPQTITPFIEPSLDQAAELDDIRYFRRIHVKVQVTPERPEVMSIERPSRTIKFNPKAFSYGFDIQATERWSRLISPRFALQKR